MVNDSLPLMNFFSGVFYCLGDSMFLRSGSLGSDVEELQRKLVKLGFLKAAINGKFGPSTEKAVVEFQKSVALNADGIAGPKTLAALNLSITTTSYPVRVPNGFQQILETFGDPLLAGYWDAYGDFCATPPELNHVFNYQWQNKNGFWCNKLVVIHFQNVYQRIVERGLADKLSTFDGCYNIRKVRGRDNLSTHSWGIAVDHDAETNRLGAPGKMDLQIVECFEKEGFVWGGRWTRKDCMHFQFAKGY